MKRFYSGIEDMCPECGHLISKKSWDCPFCGSDLQDNASSDFELHTGERPSAYHDLTNKPGGTGWQIASS